MMQLSALVLSPDEALVRLLRRTLSDLEIAVEHCADSVSAIQQLTRRRFEAVIVDAAAAGSQEVLRSVRRAPGNKRAVAVVIQSRQRMMQEAFTEGAQFVLFQPFNPERARSNLRTVRALMARERRRNTRIALEIPVTLSSGGFGEGALQEQSTSVDFGEGGMALRRRGRDRISTRWHLRFTLPSVEIELTVRAELAWTGADGVIGLRFLDLSHELREQIRTWLRQVTGEINEEEDPPMACRLSDLSAGGCYVLTEMPFPVGTTVSLRLKASGAELRSDGRVIVMHPERGMGVQFTAPTPEATNATEALIAELAGTAGVAPQVLVEPESMDTEPMAAPQDLSDDPLLDLFYRGREFATDRFFRELECQRSAAPTEEEDNNETILLT